MKTTRVWLLLPALLLAIGHGQETKPPSPQETSSADPEWTLAVLPLTEYGPDEMELAIKWVARLKPDAIVLPAESYLLDPLLDTQPHPRILSIDRSPTANPDKLTSNPAEPPGENPSAHAIRRAGGTPATIIEFTKRGTSPRSSQSVAGGTKSMEEQRTSAIRRIQEVSATTAGDVVIFRNQTLPPMGEHGFRIPVDGQFGTSLARRAVMIANPNLPTELPGRPGISGRLLLMHLITGRPGGIDWDVLPIDGSPAIWHASTAESAAPDGKSIPLLTGPPPFRQVPLWMDEYVTGNPSLLPWLPHPRVPVAVAPLEWSEGSGCPRGFPKLEDDETGNFEDFGFSPLPHDAVRSPTLRLVFLPCRYDETGAIETDGDDGMNTYLGDLRSGEAGNLYFAGLHGAWPEAATWFTDRYLLVSGIAPPAYQVYGGQPDPGEEDSPENQPHVEVRLFDLKTGVSHSSRVSAAPAAHEPTFTEKICLPPNPDQPNEDPRSSPWRVLWDAVQADLEPRVQTAPLGVSEAASQTGQTPPDAVSWTSLGPWPPAETWQLVRTKEGSKPRPPGDVTPDSLVTSRPGPHGGRIYTLAIRTFADHYDKFTEEPPPVAYADILTTGGGYMPRLSAIRRMGDGGGLLLLAGNAPSPGPPPQADKQWMMLIDNHRHHAWRLDWIPGSSPENLIPEPGEKHPDKPSH